MHVDLQASWIKRGSTGRRCNAKVLPCHSLSRILNTSWWSGWKINLKDLRWPIWPRCWSRPDFNGLIVIPKSQWSNVVFQLYFPLRLKPQKHVFKTWSWVGYNSEYTLKHVFYQRTLVVQPFLTLSHNIKCQAKASPSTFYQRWSNMGAWQSHFSLLILAHIRFRRLDMNLVHVMLM